VPPAATPILAVAVFVSTLPFWMVRVFAPLPPVGPMLKPDITTFCAPLTPRMGWDPDVFSMRTVLALLGRVAGDQFEVTNQSALVPPPQFACCAAAEPAQTAVSATTDAPISKRQRMLE
jgi:hypothetical protein